MKLDAHVHTHYSGMTHIWPLSYIVRESYNTPERVYRLAKARGMDLVAITDHDTVDGAMQLAHLPDVVVGCEVSAHFPGYGVDVHLGVLDITPDSTQKSTGGVTTWRCCCRTCASRRFSR